MVAPPTGMATPAQIDGFRELRTRLLAMGQGLRLRRFTTLVVPMKRGSGASFVARNLAAAFTMEGNGTALLIDCNLTNASQHVHCHAHGELGLFAFLEEPQAHTIERLVQPTGMAGLHVITAGPARFREYYSTPPMLSLMGTLRQRDCFVFFDGPPTEGSPDARILAELADFIVLVVGYGMAKPDEIADAAALFDRNKFAGVIFNGRG